MSVAIAEAIRSSECSRNRISMPSTIIIADDHPLFRGALKQIIPQLDEEFQVLEAESYGELQELLSENPQVDLVLVDLKMPGARGFAGLAQIKAEFPAQPVVLVSATEDPHIIRKTLSFGVSGYIPKSATFEQIRFGLNAVLEGEIWMPESIKDDVEQMDDEHGDLIRKLSSLTPQQFKVLAMIADGKLNKQIAFELNIQETTTKQHVSAILRKLNVINRTAAGVIFNQLQIDSPELGDR